MHASHTAITILTLGVLLLIGLATGALSRRIRLPRVTILILCGVLIGPSGLDLLPEPAQHWYTLVSNIALLLVGFLLGGKLSLSTIKDYGRPVLSISALVVVGVTLLVFLGLLLAGAPMPVALVLAGIATATDPAAVANVAEEVEAKGRFTDILLGIVAIDDAWGLIAFSVLLAIASAVAGAGGAGGALAMGSWELLGAVAVGVLLGIPSAFITDRISKGEPMQAEALGFVLVCGGLALWLEVSYLLAAMVLGVWITNTCRHEKDAFETIREMEWPILILFFILAGAQLDVDRLLDIGFLGAVFLVLRAAGRYLGALAGAGLAGTSADVRRWMGTALMPQAGVALGMALVASTHFPEHKDVILPLVIGTTVVFELLGPVLTRAAIVRVGEAHQANDPDQTNTQ
jgi:Kef-type K+ transport system membrane component KefB